MSTCLCCLPLDQETTSLVFTDMKTLIARHMLSCQIPYGLGVEKLLFMVFHGWFLRKYLFLNASVVYQLLIASPIAGVEISW